MVDKSLGAPVEFVARSMICPHEFRLEFGYARVHLMNLGDGAYELRAADGSGKSMRLDPLIGAELAKRPAATELD